MKSPQVFSAVFRSPELEISKSSLDKQGFLHFFASAL